MPYNKGVILGTGNGTMASGLRTLLIGVDAACLPVLEPLFDDSDLPTLERVFEEGASGSLESQIPPWTASAWPSLFTGTNPGKHGIFDFLRFEGYEWSVVNATHVRQPALWELLSHRGLSSVVVNVPVTHPPVPFDGALVPGYTAPEDPTCQPEGILTDIREETGTYRVYPEHTGDSSPDPGAVVAEHRDLAAMRSRAFRYLAERFDPDFGFLQFQGTDSVVHELEGDREALAAVYRAVDDAVKNVLESCDPDTIIVASDHGIGPYDGCEVRVNELLREANLLETTRGGEGMPTWASARDGQLASGEAPDTDVAGSPGLLARASSALARVGVTSQRVAAVLEPLGLEDTVAAVLPREAIRAGTEQVDFPNSTAYVRSRVECGVRLNVAGRDPDGVVAPDEYEAVRERVCALLEDLETPAGDPVFETVAPCEEFYHGPEVDHAVDVVVVPTEFDHLLSAQLRESVFDDPREPWNHERHGVVAVRGGPVDHGVALEGAHLFDIAPTVLATLGEPVADHMDGDPLPVVGAPGKTAYPVDCRREATAEQSDVAETRLRDLGYLE
jgi:predicted AlkP superfamily phosphohydrolase/phosphomutase